MLPVKFLSQLRLYFPLLIIFSLMGCSKEKSPETSGFVQDDTLCQFHLGYCDKNVADINLQLLITPFDTPSEKPLNISIISSKEIDDLKVRIEGRDMFMGVIPVNMNKAGENIYKGELIYGSCSSDYMVWRAFVSFTLKGEAKVAIFDFLADNQV
ncbi:hypothetical protein [Shewanella woodyi]|uniref:hypothetical protein n=1 Tax=Shewanella woodyi TaxID=60961 RepID=UPI0009EEC08B|nr:hypothetical protein [Shewanella woodyi]